MDIKSACLNVLNQIDEVLAQISEEDYRKPITTLSNATVGQHVRHTLEFFQCLKSGVERGVVNYDLRTRDEEVQSEPARARQVILALKEFIDNTTVDTPVSFEVNYGETEEAPQIIPSNFERELSYNIEHAVHHMAIFKIGLNEVAGYVSIPDGFGVAVSTLRYQREQAIDS